MNKSTNSQSDTKIWQVIFIAFAAIIFTTVWLIIYENVNTLIWQNPLITTHKLALPALILFFSLIVGLVQKYLHAQNVINGGAIDAFKGGSKDTGQKIPFIGTLISSLCSLFSGAAVGPEGALGALVEQISKYFRRKMKINSDASSGFDSAAMASAYNGIIGSPLFTGILATELRPSGKTLISFLTWNLLAGAIGFLVFYFLGLPEFAKYIPFTPINELNPSFVFWAVLLGFIGTILGALIAFLFHLFQNVFEKVFGQKIILRTLSAGCIVAFVGFFVPEVLFAGETQIFPMLKNPSAYGVTTLLIYSFLKLFLLSVSFKGGFLGGPTFPILFACTMIGLALSLLFPGIPVSIFVMCLEVAVITLVLKAPLSAILLVGLIGTADSNTVVLLVISAVTAMILGESLKKRTVKKVPSLSQS